MALTSRGGACRPLQGKSAALGRPYLKMEGGSNEDLHHGGIWAQFFSPGIRIDNHSSLHRRCMEANCT